MNRTSRLAALLLSTGVIAAAPTPALRAGLWQFDNMPQTATLDGRRLAELPYTPWGPQSVCLSPREAATPARWFARDSGSDCTFTKTSIAGGKVDIAGSCPPSDTGFDRGTVHLTGRWTPTSYTIRFATLTHGDNGHMGFDGAMTGKRIGDCPKGSTR